MYAIVVTDNTTTKTARKIVNYLSAVDKWQFVDPIKFSKGD